MFSYSHLFNKQRFFYIWQRLKQGTMSVSYGGNTSIVFLSFFFFDYSSIKIIAEIIWSDLSRGTVYPQQNSMIITVLDRFTYSII